MDDLDPNTMIKAGIAFAVLLGLTASVPYNSG